jgi:hypothetical protein
MKSPKGTKGRPRKRQPKPGERVSLGLRVTPGLKLALDSAARVSGRSQSQEAEFRIEQTFFDQKRMVEALDLTFGPELAGILLGLGEAMMEAGKFSFVMFELSHGKFRRPSGQMFPWFEVPYAYEQAMQAANAVLEAFKPPGPVLLPKRDDTDEEAKYNSTDGRSIADDILKEAATGHPSSQGAEERARMLHRVLGPLFQRLRRLDPPGE